MSDSQDIKALRAEWAKDGYGLKGAGVMWLSQLDTPFERDFHAMRKQVAELTQQVAKLTKLLSNPH